MNTTKSSLRYHVINQHFTKYEVIFRKVKWTNFSERTSKDYFKKQKTLFLKVGRTFRQKS